MKNIKSLLILMLAVFAVSCVEKEPDYKDFPGKDVDFTFCVDGNEYSTDYYYVSTLQFTNTSAKSGAVTWDFGDGTTSTEANPTHKYAQSGKYKVSLTIDGVGTCTYPILIMDIAPAMSVVAQSSDTVVINDVTIELGLELPNPDNLKCKFIWKMPEGTTLADGTPLPEFEGYSHEDGTIDNPGALKFKNIGSQKIEVQTYFDIEGENRRLSDSYINVQVGFSEEAATIYYASYGGNVKAYKIIPADKLPEGTKNMPFDMGVSSGVTPQNLVFASVEGEDFIYILDCGKNFCYQNDPDGVLGDGKINVMSADGSYANMVITNVGGFALSDPFHGCVMGDNLLYTDRNNGVSSIPLTTRGEVEKRLQSNTASFNVVNNATLGYYGRGIAYGAAHSAIAVDKDGVYWWPKNYNASGIFRFKAEHIGVTDKAPTSILLDGATMKAFALDEKRKHMYCYLTSGAVGAGFAQYPLVGFEEGLGVKDYSKYIKMSVAATAGTPSSYEALYVSQFAIDDETGNVYFGFVPDGDTERTVAGLYYYDYAAGNVVKAPLANTEGDKIFGICINPRKTKLF